MRTFDNIMNQRINLNTMRNFDNNQLQRNLLQTKGLGWKTKRRLGYDRSTTKQLIIFIEQLF
jgi:hypothetical protein